MRHILPVLTPGNLTLAVMHKYENVCLGYFENKEIEEKKQVRKILAELMDSRIQDWISVDHNGFIGLTFAEFMKELCTMYLPKDWEEVTRIELLAMTQNSDTFWDFSIAVQAKSLLLRDTPSYQDKEQICYRLKARMNPKLTLHCHLEKLSQVKKFEAWLTEVKCVDDLVHNERSEFEAYTKATRDTNRCNNIFTEPSCHNNTNYSVSGSTNNTTQPTLPRLLDTEHQLLYGNSSCLKCHHVLVKHCSKDCPNGFPNTATYKVLTQAFVDIIKQCVKKPLAAVLPQTYDDDFDESAVVHPITAVMGLSHNPIVYMPSKESNVIKGGSDSDESVSISLAVTAVVPENKNAKKPKASMSHVAPFTVPHLFWRCSVNRAKEDFPVLFDVLIDHGSHAVLISDKLTRSLRLKCWKLHNPMPIEIAILDKNVKCVIVLSEWVKLSMNDPLGLWTSKTVCTIITPSLCAPVILGLPFLTHNNIVVDHACCTTMDKESGFDLLNPSPPPPPAPPKRKLKDFFHGLKEDCKMLVAELKMVCAESLCRIKDFIEELKQ